ncbi:hypothetical protein J2Y03_004632 [Neobacillus niacini]|uniref:polysialyltransferase family glycosyltransferase n=1 Tax=Neobacillus niacini TaxID=86668 RepID=UPI00285D94B1|nr:polysialyltransferase family glycosyltransferase [Neobacillus niacini]MDR7079574.1 hypothetical protein [Neobacillus niacini]
MKKNLFVMHTQYNLILACGLTLTDFSKDENDLILFTDFALMDDMKNRLEKIFNRIIYLSGSFPKTNENYLKKIKRYPDIMKKLDNFIIKSYDNTFIVDDICIPEMYIMKQVYKNNKNSKFIWLEDGGIAYFSNNVKSGGLASNTFTMTLRKYIFKYLFGLGRFYDYKNYMGSHYMLDTVYSTFPKQLKSEYKGKKIYEISKNAFMEGLNSIYPTSPITIKGKSLIVIMDMLSIYEDVEKISTILRNVLEKYKECGYSIYYKYHPRELNKLAILHSYIELDRNQAMESLYSGIKAKEESIIIGIKSTGLQTASKLGFKVVSLIKYLEPDEKEVSVFYHNIGIDTPSAGLTSL